MQIEDKRIKEEKANIGDIIITNEGNMYMLLSNQGSDYKEYPRALYNIEENRIECTTKQELFIIKGTTVYNGIIKDIIPKSRIKLVIE